MTSRVAEERASIFYIPLQSHCLLGTAK